MYRAVNLFVLISYLSSITNVQGQERNVAAPWFCHGLQCPNFKVLNTTDKYQIREYEGGSWAGTTVQSLLYSVGLTKGFERLFKYISGDNEDKQKIAMTAPVVTRITPGDGPFCESTFSVHFFVPFKWQDKPPAPTNAEVSIFKPGKEVVAVSSFGGFLVDDFTLSSKAKALQDALTEDGISHEEGSFLTAGYDPPYRLQHRHNEILIRLSKDSSEHVESVLT